MFCQVITQILKPDKASQSKDQAQFLSDDFELLVEKSGLNEVQDRYCLKPSDLRVGPASTEDAAASALHSHHACLVSSGLSVSFSPSAAGSRTSCQPRPAVVASASPSLKLPAPPESGSSSERLSPRTGAESRAAFRQEAEDTTLSELLFR